MSKVLAIIGDAWHAPSVIRRGIVTKFEERGFAVDCIIDSDVPFPRLNDYDVILLSRYALDDQYHYKTNVKKPWISPEQEQCIESFVNEGGKLFIHHDGIGYYEKGNGITRLAKAHFLSHPPIGPITIQPVVGFDELNKGIDNYEIWDEEYLLEIEENETHVFLESYSKNNGRSVQGWFHPYGLGKVIVFVPGHDDTVIRNEMVSKGIVNAVDWLVGDE